MLDARITKQFGGKAGSGLKLDVHLRLSGGITVLFGHSGAGKTTILRSIAGILRPDAGRITLRDKVYFDSGSGIDMPIQKRKVGYVFQNHVLFPHLTAEQNVSYGIGRDSIAARSRVRELFSTLGIEKTISRYPHELSGGEQQRVALARALATDPLIMLMDEPLSAVDVATRSHLLEEIAAVQQRSAIPFVYVTHNQREAVRLGSAIVVLDEGRVVQEGAPLEVFNAPRTASAARAVGTENVFVGTIRRHRVEDGVTEIDVNTCIIEAPYNGIAVGNPVSLGIRSEDVIVSRERVTQTSARNILHGVIKSIIRQQDSNELVVFCGIDLKVSVTRAAIRILELEPGSEVYLLIKARAIHVLA